MKVIFNNTQSNTAGIKEPASATQKDQRLKELSRQFEALFTSYLLKAMNKTIEKSTLTNRGVEENIYSDMLFDEYANLISRNRSLGLADVVYKSLKKDEEAKLDLIQEINNTRSQNLLNHVMLNKAWNSYKSNSISQENEPHKNVERYGKIIAEAADKYNLDPDLIKALIHQESSGRFNAISDAGAKGLMQLMDSTAAAMGVENIYNPYENIMGGARYMRKLLDRYNGDENLALASYNAGPGAVEKFNGIPPYKETENYIERVKKLREMYKSQNVLPGSNK